MNNMTIKKQLTIIFIIVTILPISILGIFHSIEMTDFITQSSKNQKYATQRLAESVETYVNFHVNYIESISYNLSQSQNWSIDYMTMLLKGGKIKLPGFIELYVGNSDGKIIASYPRNSQEGEFLLGEDISNRDHFKEIKATERTVVTPILLGRHSKKPLIMIEAPILQESQFQGYVLGTLDLTALKKIIIDYDYGIGAYPVVEDQDHKVIYHPVLPLISKNYELKNLMQQYHFEDRLLGDGEFYSTVNHRYEYLSFEKIPSLNWVVYVSQPTSFKTESIRNAMILLGIVLVATLIFTQNLAKLLAQRMLDPINVLIEYSAAIERKSFSLENFDKIQMTNAAKEFNLLLNRFYEMGKNVFRNREELIKLNLDLERRIAERTEGLVKDITKEKEIDRLKNQLISFTSHEFKTPITTLSGSIETLLRKDIEWEEDFIDEILLGMKDDIQRLEQLTSDWIDIVKIDSNALVLINEQMRIGSFIEGVIQGLKKPPYTEAKIVFKRCEASEHIVAFDIKRVEQVIRNIITNAIRYSKGNPTIFIRVYEDKESIYIDFKDNGIGIAEEHIPKIFDRFFHVDASRTRKTGGTGLGLAICKGIIEAHGWEIKVVSQLNKGSTFTIVIPKNEQVK
ncbi:sensor histidine kinase [Cytobacillus dafuensis]|nr:ATP-binding protein [Cytobacillus dafuensis]